MITNNGANGQDVSQQLTMAQQSMNQPGQSNIPAPMSAPNVMNNPLDFLFQAATKDEDTEISLDTLKQSEIDKIMDAYSRCKGVADNYYKSTIRPKLQKREQQYLATEDYYKKRFPVLSETSKFCSRDIKTTIDWMIPSMCEPFIGSDDPVDIKGVNVDDDDKATKIQQLLKYQLQRKNSYPSFINAIWRDALRLNYAVSKVYWKRDEDRERYKLMVSGKDAQIVGMISNEALQGKIEIIEKKPVKDAPDLSIITFEKIIVKANHPVIQYMSPSELRFTPDGHSVQDAKFKAHRKLVTGDYLKRKEQEGVYQNIDKAIKEFSGDTTYDLFDTDKNKELSTVNERIKDDDNASKMFELYESYMQVDYNNDGIYENLIIHAVGNTPIRIAKNDFDMAPFFIAYAEISPTTAFNENESFTDNILQQQDLKTAVFRQIITNVAKNNSPRTFVNNNVDIDALINNEEIVLCNTSENPASSISTGSQLPISPLSMQIIEYAQNEIESQTGSTRYNQGLDSNSLNKMLALDTPIPLADGTYKQNKDIVEGDMVIGSNGKPIEVLVAHPIQMPKRAFKITFQSGDVIKAGGEHRWAVKMCDKNYHHKSNEFEKLPTERIYDLMKKEYKAFIPRVGKVDFTRKELPLNPYIFGLWLGDGNSHTNRFTTMDSEIKSAFEDWSKKFYKGHIVPCKQQHSGKAITYSVVNTPFRQMLKDLKCLKDNRYDKYLDNVKHIPDIYLRGSFEQRLSLLQGLMDTDGCIDKHGNAIFCNSEPELIKGVVLLIESLGGKPNVNWKYNVGNKFKHARPHAHITFAMPYCPVRISRKVARWKTKMAYWDSQKIVSIEEIETEPMRCLTVNAKDELYCCGKRLTLTSNTATGLTAIMGSSEKRMKHMARMFAENFIIPLMKYVILLDQKYLDQEQMIRLADENIIIDKAELDIDYDLIINVGLGAGTREAQIQYLMVLIQQIYPVLAQTGIVTPVSWYEIVKDLLEKMGIRNTENYLIDPNSDVAKQAQQQAAQAQQQAQQQALQLEQAKAQLEIEKARQPHFTIRYEDLPPEAQLQALKYLGIQLNSGDIIQKEQLEYVKKNQKPDAPNIPAAGSSGHR